MAKINLKNEKCASGSLYVDTTCIDCATCFHIAPQIFKEGSDSKSFNYKQPESLLEWTQAKEAVLSCPTKSIGVEHAPHEFAQAPLSLPRLITDEIYYCGYTAESSFGATTYLIVHPEGNILVDSPRFNKQLAQQIETLGGIKYLFLTHRDDVADHKHFAEYFGCKRIIHTRDVVEDTRNCEMILEGDSDYMLLNDVRIITTPGHTPGHLVLLYKKQYLFTGDHLFYDQESGLLYASKSVNWFSWEEQVKSLRKLLSLSFEWVLPGHGGWVHKNTEVIKKELAELI